MISGWCGQLGIPPCGLCKVPGCSHPCHEAAAETSEETE